ncbi:MAG TPA: PAS domain S-box protein [Capsulimonadaceae bacterium]|jgi:PAS domain S-box-containing protein
MAPQVPAILLFFADVNASISSQDIIGCIPPSYSVVTAATLEDTSRLVVSTPYYAAILVAATVTETANQFVDIAARAKLPTFVVTSESEPGAWSPIVTDVIDTNELSAPLLVRSLRLAAQARSQRLGPVGDHHLARVFDLAPEILCVVDRDSRCLAVNASFERILGYSEDEMLMVGLYTLVHPDDIERSACARAEAMKGTTINDFVNRYRSKGGEYHWLSWSTVRDPETGVGFAAGREITNTKKTEDHLKLLESAMLASTEGIVIIEYAPPTYPVVYANPAYERIMDSHRLDLLGKSLSFLTGPSDEQPGLKVVRRALYEGVATSTVFLNRVADSEFWCELSMSPILNAGGEITHYVGFISDITYRIVMERALRESQERLNGILSSVTDMVYSIAYDDPNTVLYISPAAFQLLGSHPEEFYTGARTLRSTVHPDDLPIVNQIEHDARSFGHAEGEFRAFHRNGSIRWIYDRSILVKDSAGNPVRIDGISTDISEQKMLRQAAIQADKLAALGELVAGVAHEINNPLSIISGHAQILEMTQDGPVKEDAATITRMAKRASNIVASLLTFARKQEGMKTLASVELTVRAAIELAAYKMVRHGINLTVDIAEGLPMVLMNSTEIEQVMLNLLGNSDHAVQNNPQSERNITITAQASVEGQPSVVIQVVDNGSGIAEDVIGRIFDPFYTTKPVGEGTGLGLSICHGIIVAHGGTITASSTPDGGTTMTVKLPAIS